MVARSFLGGEFAGGESAWWRGDWIPDDNTNLTLTIFDQTTKNLLIAIGKKDMPQTEDNITEVFLDLPLVEITFNKETKIVTDVVPKA